MFTLAKIPCRQTSLLAIKADCPPLAVGGVSRFGRYRPVPGGATVNERRADVRNPPRWCVNIIDICRDRQFVRSADSGWRVARELSRLPCTTDDFPLDADPAATEAAVDDVVAERRCPPACTPMAVRHAWSCRLGDPWQPPRNGQDRVSCRFTIVETRPW